MYSLWKFNRTKRVLFPRESGLFIFSSFLMIFPLGSKKIMFSHTHKKSFLCYILILQFRISSVSLKYFTFIRSRYFLIKKKKSAFKFGSVCFCFNSILECYLKSFHTSTYIEAPTFLTEEFSKIHSADRKLINIYIKGLWTNFTIFS